MRHANAHKVPEIKGRTTMPVCAQIVVCQKTGERRHCSRRVHGSMFGLWFCIGHLGSEKNADFLFDYTKTQSSEIDWLGDGEK